MCSVDYYIIVYCKLSNKRSQFTWSCSPTVAGKFTIFTRTIWMQNKYRNLHDVRIVSTLNQRLVCIVQLHRAGNRRHFNTLTWTTRWQHHGKWQSAASIHQVTAPQEMTKCCFNPPGGSTTGNSIVLLQSTRWQQFTSLNIGPPLSDKRGTCNSFNNVSFKEWLLYSYFEMNYIIQFYIF